MFIKYFVNPTFKREEFTDLLNSRGVSAAAVADGVIMDLDAFNAINLAHMPAWMFVNRKHINSKYHTRPASMQEYRDAKLINAGIKAEA